MIKSIRLFGFVFFLFSAVTMAGTVVEIQSKDELTTILTDGQRARINMGGSNYIIVDYSEQSVKMVSPEKQQVILFNETAMTSGNKSTAAVRTAIERLGEGKEVAGYKTQRFGYAANGKQCAVIYGSWDAYQAKGIKELLTAMKTVMEKQQALIGGFAALVDDCVLADMQISNHVDAIGVPMRTEKNGQVDTEIKSIKVDAEIPDDVFTIPASYKTVSMQQQLSGLSENMARMQQHVQQYQPTAPQMMRQMQPPAQLSPQAMEQMRRTQGMPPRY
jgi:outer membrane lipoprotein-sorting protein